MTPVQIRRRNKDHIFVTGQGNFLPFLHQPWSLSPNVEIICHPGGVAEITLKEGTLEFNQVHAFIKTTFNETDIRSDYV